MLEIKGDKVPALRCNPLSVDSEDSGGCNEREMRYIEKKKDKPAVALGEEIKRLEGMKESKMADELAGWINRRIRILNLLKESKGEEKEL